MLCTRLELAFMSYFFWSLESLCVGIAAAEWQRLQLLLASCFSGRLAFVMQPMAAYLLLQWHYSLHPAASLSHGLACAYALMASQIP